MRVDSSEYQALQDRYLALNVPLGIKKIPVVFIFFEIPRFYHYVDFLNRRLGKKCSDVFFLARREHCWSPSPKKMSALESHDDLKQGCLYHRRHIWIFSLEGNGEGDDIPVMS